MDNRPIVATQLERDMAALNAKLAEAIRLLEMRLPGQSRFVDFKTAEFASEVLHALRTTTVG